VRTRPSRRPEASFLVAGLQATAVTAVLCVPVAALLAGSPGIVGAAAAVALVAILFGLSAALHLVTAPLGRDVWVLTTVGGFAFRLVLYFAVLRALADVEALHGLSLGLTAAAGILIGQVFEMRALVRARTLAVVTATVGKSEGVDR